MLLLFFFKFKVTRYNDQIRLHFDNVITLDSVPIFHQTTITYIVNLTKVVENVIQIFFRKFWLGKFNLYQII